MIHYILVTLVVIIESILIVSSLLAWRKIMTNEESALASIASVSETVEDARSTIRDVIWPSVEAIKTRLEALILSLPSEPVLPESVLTALSELSEQTKALSAASEIGRMVPSEIDSAFEAVTKVP